MAKETAESPKKHSLHLKKRLRELEAEDTEIADITKRLNKILMKYRYLLDAEAGEIRVSLERYEHLTKKRK